MDQPFVVGSCPTPGGEVPVVSARLEAADFWGTFKARWGVGRMEYLVDPGLYAVGKPVPESPVLITANYKMSFDRLRSSLRRRSAWILVLDTDGINVWCAAGKGTFGTDELVRRIGSSGLPAIVTHRKVVVPQLGAPGICAQKVKEQSGFRVVYGPVRSEDLGLFLDGNMKATPEMRRKSFPLGERIVLIPVEFVDALKAAVMAAPVLLILSGFGGPGTYWSNVGTYGLFAVLAVFAAVVAGSVAAPILLPWLPGRAFAVKGVWPGLAVAVVLLIARGMTAVGWPSFPEAVAWLLMIPAASAFLAMNFTGASTYTSLSGVRKEMRYAVPLQIIAVVVGFGLWVASRFSSFS